jgi:hypothetical protein
MASGLELAQQKQLDDVGRPTELINQLDFQAAAEEAISALEATAISPSDLFATVEEKVTAVTNEVELSDACNIDFSPNLISLTSLMMTAISNPTGAALAGLQGLMDGLAIKPPGFNLPSFDLDLDLPSFDLGLDLPDISGFLPDISLPNISLPSLSFGLSQAGGFDMSSMLSGVAGLLTIPPIGGCGTLLPDIGPGAELMSGKLPTGLPEGESGGLANPFKNLGNKQIKEGFDKLGNAVQIVINSGAPAKIAQSAARAQAAAAALGTFEAPGFALGGLLSSDVVPPVYGATKEALAKIKGEVEDPFFAELINGTLGTETPETILLTLEEKIASRNTQSTTTNVSTGLATSASV